MVVRGNIHLNIVILREYHRIIVLAMPSQNDHGLDCPRPLHRRWYFLILLRLSGRCSCGECCFQKVQVVGSRSYHVHCLAWLLQGVYPCRSDQLKDYCCGLSDFLLVDHLILAVIQGLLQGWSLQDSFNLRTLINLTIKPIIVILILKGDHLVNPQ